MRARQRRGGGRRTLVLVVALVAVLVGACSTDDGDQVQAGSDEPAVAETSDSRQRETEPGETSSIETGTVDEFCDAHAQARAAGLDQLEPHEFDLLIGSLEAMPFPDALVDDAQVSLDGLRELSELIEPDMTDAEWRDFGEENQELVTRTGTASTRIEEFANAECGPPT